MYESRRKLLLGGAAALALGRIPLAGAQSLSRLNMTATGTSA